MSCNAPIDINTTRQNKCNLKCLYWYNYGNSSCKIKNNNEYITITYDGQSSVTYNSESYTPKYMNLFKPALHSFNGKKADAELIIVHNNLGKGLLVCIPIVETTTYNIPQIQQIIEQTPNQGDNDATINLPDFNLNNMIPKAPYYSYTGSLAWDCKIRTQFNYIVFNPSDGAISVNYEVLQQLDKLISPMQVSTHPGIVYYNQAGTKNNNELGDDQIYIDCQPTGESGEMIEKESKEPVSSLNDTMNSIYNFIYSILYVLLGCFIIYFINALINKLTRIKNQPSSINNLL